MTACIIIIIIIYSKSDIQPSVAILEQLPRRLAFIKVYILKPLEQISQMPLT